MKKLLAITVVFALVLGVAFAESTVSGDVEVRWAIAQDDGSGTITTGGSIDHGTVGFRGANDENTYGGRFQFVFEGTSGANYDTKITSTKWDCAYAWWQPIEQFKLFIGQDGDGMFNTANLSRWGHHHMPRGVAVEDWDAGNYLIGNWDNFGLALIIKPIEGLSVNLAFIIPGVNTGNYKTVAGDPGAVEYGDFFKSLQAQIAYSNDSIGTIYFTYRGENNRDPGNRIGLTYLSGPFIDGLQFEVGGNYEIDGNDPIRFGVGVHYGQESWGVKFRAFIHPETDFYVKADIMPWYAFDFGTVFLNIRIVNAAKIGWHINPYLSINVGAGDFRVGALFENEDGVGDLTWKIPVSMLVSF